MDAKLLGNHCWVSGKRIDHVLEPENVSQVTILLLDGRHISISLHKDYVEELDLNILWHQMRESEIFHHEKLKTSPQSHKNQMALLAPPLAVLGVR